MTDDNAFDARPRVVTTCAIRWEVARRLGVYPNVNSGPIDKASSNALRLEGSLIAI